jgi:hypothetical protein
VVLRVWTGEAGKFLIVWFSEDVTVTSLLVSCFSENDSVFRSITLADSGSAVIAIEGN